MTAPHKQDLPNKPSFAPKEALKKWKPGPSSTTKKSQPSYFPWNTGCLHPGLLKNGWWNTSPLNLWVVYFIPPKKNPLNNNHKEGPFFVFHCSTAWPPRPILVCRVHHRCWRYNHGLSSHHSHPSVENVACGLRTETKTQGFCIAVSGPLSRDPYKNPIDNGKFTISTGRFHYWYCWWLKSSTSWGWYFISLIPLFTRFKHVLYIPGGCLGSLPSTVPGNYG